MPSPRVVHIDVYIDDPSSDPPSFRVVPSENNSPPLTLGPDDEIIFHNDRHPGFDICFELKDNTHGYFFPPTSQKNDAVWSRIGCECPKSEVREVFQPIRTEETSPGSGELRRLVVHNSNPKPAQGRFKYTLRVTNGTGWKDLDPGGDNTNGQTSLTSNYIAIGGIAVTTGVLSALATVLVGRPLFCS